MEKATFAAGCFWGVEAAFREIKGVVDARVGYIGGHLKDPNYELVCTGTSGHAEAVEVDFDPSIASYDELLIVFWNCHDPTTLNRQGPDRGTQYRSAIYFHNEQQERAARASLAEADASGRFCNPIVTEITAAPEFYLAEDYHQQYFAKRGQSGGCHW